MPGVALAVEDAMKPRTAKVAVDEAHALAALREGDRDAARHRRLSLRRRRARHEDRAERPVGVHEHQVRADACAPLRRVRSQGADARAAPGLPSLASGTTGLAAPAPPAATTRLAFLELGEETEERDAELLLDVVRRLDRAVELLAEPRRAEADDEADDEADAEVDADARPHRGHGHVRRARRSRRLLARIIRARSALFHPGRRGARRAFRSPDASDRAGGTRSPSC